ncbi:MAG: methylmalonyl-CoA mutase family protein, partial [Actinomycetota bacterium]|nr:methylmalonyl-CoA mutase family protein [Actinomycetota bacterium]
MTSQLTPSSPERDQPQGNPPSRPRSPERDQPEPFPPTRSVRDRPWIMRTYSGHSSAAASNLLYRANLEKGQTGLSVAFDLPTQTGYDSDHEL